MTPTWIDHGLMFFLVAITPFLAVRRFRRLAQEGRAGGSPARLSGYARTMVRLWTVALVVVAVWIGSHRGLPALGLGWRWGVPTWIGLGLTLVACALLIRQSRKIRRNPAIHARLLPRLEPYRALLPSGEREWGWWVALALTAGICEELTYRGFLMAYFGHYGGAAGAAVGSSLAFGFGHLYQGAKGMARTGGTGLIMAGLYLLTGSLWAPMVLHSVIDVSSGRIARDVLRRAAPAPSGTGLAS